MRWEGVMKRYGVKTVWNSNLRDGSLREETYIIHMLSYKFIAFIGGPRTCLGKELSFLQIKMVAIAILRNYRVHVVEDHPICLSLSVVIQMKYGLKVRITKQSSLYWRRKKKLHYTIIYKFKVMVLIYLHLFLCRMVMWHTIISLSSTIIQTILILYYFRCIDTW